MKFLICFAFVLFSYPAFSGHGGHASSSEEVELSSGSGPAPDANTDYSIQVKKIYDISVNHLNNENYKKAIKLIKKVLKRKELYGYKEKFETLLEEVNNKISEQ